MASRNHRSLNVNEGGIHSWNSTNAVVIRAWSGSNSFYRDLGRLRVGTKRVDEAVYKKQPYQPPICDPGYCRVIGGNGKAYDFKGLAGFPVTLARHY